MEKLYIYYLSIFTIQKSTIHVDKELQKSHGSYGLVKCGVKRERILWKTSVTQWKTSVTTVSMEVRN